MKRLTEVVRALKSEVTRLTGKRPVDAIRKRGWSMRIIRDQFQSNIERRSFQFSIQYGDENEVF